MSHEPNLVALRYTDLCDEPVTCLLPPIIGYQDVPLVTLEESIKPIAHLFDKIEINICITKMGMANPMNDLSVDESVSIHLYTMPSDSGLSVFQALNAALRNENRQTLKPWLSYLKLFLTALYKLPSQIITVWRGVRDIDLRSKYPVGSKLVWWGVSSCTATIEKLESEQILGRKGLRTLFCIQCQNGKSIISHSYSQNTENEVILMPGFHFEVLDQINPTNDLYVICLKEIQPSLPPVDASFLTPAKQPSDN